MRSPQTRQITQDRLDECKTTRPILDVNRLVFGAVLRHRVNSQQPDEKAPNMPPTLPTDDSVQSATYRLMQGGVESSNADRKPHACLVLNLDKTAFSRELWRGH